MIFDGDVARTYAERARRDARSILRRLHWWSHFHLGSMGGFLTPLNWMRRWIPCALLSLLISRRESLGVSIENRPLWQEDLTQSGCGGTEPRALYGVAPCARAAGDDDAVAYDGISLERYGIDETLRNPDHRELYFASRKSDDAFNQSTNADGGGMAQEDRQNTDGSVGSNCNHAAWDMTMSDRAAHLPMIQIAALDRFRSPRLPRSGNSACANFSVAPIITPLAMCSSIRGDRNAQTPDSVVFRRLADYTRRSYYAYGTE
jgi:hypothetical protein